MADKDKRPRKPDKSVETRRLEPGERYRALSDAFIF